MGRGGRLGVFLAFALLKDFVFVNFILVLLVGARLAACLPLTLLLLGDLLAQVVGHPGVAAVLHLLLRLAQVGQQLVLVGAGGGLLLQALSHDGVDHLAVADEVVDRLADLLVGLDLRVVN